MYEGAQLFLDRFEYSTAYGAVQSLSKIAGAQGSTTSICILIASFIVAFIHSDHSVPGFTLVAQLYIANTITQFLPISDDSQSGPVLVARIALYVCLVSVLTGLIYTAAERYKQLHAFVGGLSPYAILYTAGKCISRLDKPSDALLAQIISVMYSLARLWYRKSTPPDSKDGVFARVWVNLDFLGDRLLVLAFGRYIGSVVGDNHDVLPHCIMYILALVLLNCGCIGCTLAKSLSNLVNVMLAHKIYSTLPYLHATSALFATGAMICRLFTLPTSWPTQFMWIGLCLSVVQYIEWFIAAETSQISTSVSIYCFIFLGLASLYPRKQPQPILDKVLAHATAPVGVPIDG